MSKVYTYTEKFILFSQKEMYFPGRGGVQEGKNRVVTKAQFQNITLSTCQGIPSTLSHFIIIPIGKVVKRKRSPPYRQILVVG